METSRAPLKRRQATDGSLAVSLIEAVPGLHPREGLHLHPMVLEAIAQVDATAGRTPGPPR
jgi:hypothetical protein